MEKIKLFEQRNLGNTVNSTIKLMRQNFRLISLSFLVFVMPLLIISVLFITFSISLGGPDTKTQIAINMPIFQIGFIIYMITLFVEAIVLHEVIIAYEHNDDLQNINLTDVWAFINGDFRRIIGSFLGIIPLAICFGIIAIIINTAIISISHSIGGLSILLICLTFIYIYVSMTN